MPTSAYNEKTGQWEPATPIPFMPGWKILLVALWFLVTFRPRKAWEWIIE